MRWLADFLGVAPEAGEFCAFALSIRHGKLHPLRLIHCDGIYCKRIMTTGTVDQDDSVLNSRPMRGPQILGGVSGCRSSRSVAGGIIREIIPDPAESFDKIVGISKSGLPSHRSVGWQWCIPSAAIY